MARSRKQIGYVYFVREEASGDIKIGYTSSLPNYRIAQLAAKQDKTLHIVGLMLGNKVTERSVHDDFAELALGGEWFRSGATLEAFVSALSYDGCRELKELVELRFDQRGRMSRVGMSNTA